MTAFQVICPLVVAKDESGAVGYWYRGAVIPWLSEADRLNLVDGGMVEEFDGGKPDPVPSIAGDEKVPGSTAELERPKNAAPKPEWAEYAARRGIEGVEGMSKDELVAAVNALDAQ